jgi:DNA-binding response OmpR family regulator
MQQGRFPHYSHMSSIPFRLPGLPASPPSVLVIEPVLPHLLLVISALASAGFEVTVAETFKDAKSSLMVSPPNLLVADVKLYEYNGLHLVMRARAAWKGLAAIVTSHVSDAILRGEAERMGATFLVLPTTRDELIAAVYRTMLRQEPTDSQVEPIRAPFERRHAERRTMASTNPLARDRRIADRRRDTAAALRQIATQPH